ncbi:MAG: hypothetical protein DBX59_03970 [Bacillota bacterium]|nr:MAG: hypothetical protein DBX59_03970 [Bacillota bacterium]
MKRKTKLLASLFLGSLMLLCFGVACNGAGTEGPLGEDYNWVFNKPFAGEPDEGMKIDGVLDESVWLENTYLSQTTGTTSWSATTYFTEKGLYIAAKATDMTMTYITRFTKRSAFELFICKTGTETINPNSTATHPARCQTFQLDPYYCRSKSRVEYYYEAKVDGKLNSETECTMTAELFLTWEDLYYTADELGEQGYPESIQMYVNYEGASNEVLGSCSWREETYFHYDKSGYMGELDHGDLGDATGGLAATDRWTLSEDGKPQTTAGRTQILWLKEAYAKDFMFEASLSPIDTYIDENGETKPITLRGEAVSGRIGLIAANGVSAGRYNLFSADAKNFSRNKTVTLQTCREIDSFHWQNLIGLGNQTATRDYEGESLLLRVIKKGDMFYYFYGDTYWNCERIPDLQEEAYCGIYTSQGVKIEDFRFVNYEGNTNDLESELSKYMYFVNVSGEMPRGSVTTSLYAVGKGRDVTITFLPKSRSVLTNVTIDGEERYDEVVAGMNDKCQYTFTPTADVTVEGEFTQFETKDVVKTVIVINDENDDRVMDANYEITGSDKLLFYKGEPNASGYVIVQLPKEGTYTVGGRTFEVSGDYELTALFSGHHDLKTSFVLNDGVTSVDINGNPESVKDTQSYTLYLQVRENAWGALTVNKLNVSGSGKLYFNEETGNYYATNIVRRYFKGTVATDYAADVTLKLTNVGDKNGDLAAFAVTDGNDVLVIKINLENAGKVIIATGNETTNTVAGQEYAITGFDYTKCQMPSGGGNNGYAEVSFRVVKCGSAIYLFNSDGEMKAYFNKEGVQLVNGSQIAWRGNSDAEEEIDKDIASLFGSGEETAVGLFTYAVKNINAELEMDFSTNEADIFTDAIGYGAFTLTLPEDVTLNDGYRVKTHYGMGEEVVIGVNAENAKTANARLILADGGGTRFVSGSYDWSNDCIVFKFIYAGGAAAAKITVLEYGDMDWSEDWGDFIPDRDNTLP